MPVEPNIEETQNQRKLGIIAGSGELPAQVINTCHRHGKELFVIAFEDETHKDTVANVPHKWLHIGKVGEAIKALKNENITDILMVGRVGRPTISALKMDFTAIKLLSKLSRLSSQGDDTVFLTIIEFLESKGFNVLGIKDVLNDNIIGEGPLGNISPDKLANNDIMVGKKAALTIGMLDIGQAVIVQRGQVLGVEGPEGTDKLISRCKDLHLEGPGGVLIKMKKPQQDTRVDLPSIGVHTVENAHASGLRGIAVEAGNALIIHRDDLVKKADELGIFVVGIV